MLAGEDGGNLVAVASRSAAADRGDRAQPWPTGTSPGRSPRVSQLDEFVGDAAVLTDDHAPVDQLLTPYG